MSDWPFVARDAELREAAQALRDGSRGVVLAGSAGMGKSALARVLAEELEADGCPVRFVLGTETGQPVPLGAFLHALTLTDAHDPTVMLAAAHEVLASEPDLVIVVDDAQHLDPLSALLVQQLAVHGSPKLIVTIQNGAATSDAVTALWKEQLLLRLDLEPFTREQAGELAAAVLHGDVDERAVGELHRFSSGSPLYLRGVLNAALDDGVLVCDDGRWRLRGRLRASADLHVLIASRLDALAPDERDVVEVVSTAEVLDWDVLVGACDIEAIARVERRGVIQVFNDAACTLVQPGHPIVGEVARSRCSKTRARQINTQLASLLAAHLQSLNNNYLPAVRGRIQLARFMVGGDGPADPGAIADAAASAVTMSNPTLGEELARYALDHGAGVSAVMVLADAMSWQGRGEQAEELLARSVPASDDEATLARWGCLRASNLFFGCARPDAAHAVLAMLREQLHCPQTVSLVVAMEAVFAFFAGEPADAIALGTAVLDREVSPTANVWAALATSSALALSGRSEEVAAVAQAGELAAEDCESGPQRYWLAFARVSAGIADGDLAGAHRVCDRYAVAAAGSPQAEAIVMALSGRVELARGCLPSACEALRTAVWTTPQGLPPGWPMVVAAWLAQAEGMRGNASAAAGALVRAEAAAVGPLDVFRPELELARAWVAAATGDTGLAVDHAVRAAHSAKTGGMDAVELTALHTALRFGDKSGHRRIRQLVHRHGGRAAEAIGAHSLGLARHDPAQLVAAADRFEAIRALVLAADAAAHAARTYARAGCRGGELESAARAFWLSGQSGALTPALRSAGDPLPLTDREWEIADLVGAGMSNRQIAGRLCLSVRTVDGHLYRMFAKLGVEDRDHLARLARFGRVT
ncbi:MULTISPECIES: LuxR family transcriptional regulator [unclassified Mycolicibacterium]|uniref:helix-turn-helix transcriptional regulator n=1 Tax=unclassified Mycolicibacterium TaxID=2636767 RepID=UPI0012DE9FBD|nr:MULTISPECIES: LuxR family transcriptional regulator [unclassified Mycolicibacterium]MUL80840.1 LuxR family transcriptional regulator [Mycolicibacterium sp. CBMA 329]MUL86606.1 LuxR family transcriptional regulator [Mycolicibacterium sp. CBMA 331]MUM02811.1 LuxR family transcriptional regulator [Mycolicibacterium sp. CBMA 334]MUM26303.1 LuxR family transcriptional regulator [Mycolicibacterium sp. CBMA 295]MUM36903.1 LuxR family transcriptional regulator [Mycolicibacterium sp. CBMA 247]